ncbi:DUF3014 domain-containing protein [Aliidiomarina sedimenti]|nr:DUF3014 domain-containing protein [Aliidiomarina sedimenti]
MSEHDPAQSNTPKRGLITLIALALVILLLVVVVLWWSGSDEEPDSRQSVPVEVSEPEPLPDPEPEPEPLPDYMPLPEPDSTADVDPEPDPEPEIELPELNQSTEPLLAELEEREQNVRPLRSEHLVRDMVIFVHNLSDGEVIRESAGVSSPDARFTTQEVDNQLYIDERSFARYDELVDWFVSLDSEVVVNLYEAYQPLFEQAFTEIAHPDETFQVQIQDAIDVLLATPEPEGLLALSDDSVMYTFADPDLESLPAAQKQMLRLGLENQRKVKRKLREIRARLEELN